MTTSGTILATRQTDERSIYGGQVLPVEATFGTGAGQKDEIGLADKAGGGVDALMAFLGAERAD